jgi:hypothetical protein
MPFGLPHAVLRPLKPAKVEVAVHRIASPSFDLPLQENE